MFAEFSGGQALIVVLAIIVMLWGMYMAAFKPEAYAALMKSEDERKRKRLERLGKMAVTGVKIARLLRK
jgi:hypothetical protein